MKQQTAEHPGQSNQTSMTVARPPTTPHRVIYGVRRRLPPGSAGLAATVDALASLRASFHAWGVRLMHGALIATAVFAGWWALDRFVHRDVTAEQQALELSALELAARALVPGSALPCLDPADGRTIEELGNLPGDLWVSFVVRDQQLLTVRPDTTLLAGDDVLIMAEPSDHAQLATMFAPPAPPPQEPPNGQG